MGYTGYSSTRSFATSSSYATRSREEIFHHKSINNAMNPFGIPVRESRDSVEHPNSIAIKLNLDVTGSMGSVPEYLTKHGLVHIMDKIIKSGIPDPQILFAGVGDHECDHSPYQVGQFESGDELLFKWLTDLYLEAGGGGNAGESYLLAWYFAAFKTSIDCWEKRKQKGLLFTIGDEPCLKDLPARAIKTIFGDEQASNYTAEKLLEEAMKTYNVFHVHIKETASGSRIHVIDGWKQLLHENVIVANHREDVSDLIAETVVKHIKPSGQVSYKLDSNDPTIRESTPSDSIDQEYKKSEEMML